jgi:hypothetical protein
VPLVTLAYEESFMRECMLPEVKPCSLGQFCDCNFIDREHEFVGVSFVMTDLRSIGNSMCILPVSAQVDTCFFTALLMEATKRLNSFSLRQHL